MYILNDINDDINVTHIDIEIHQPWRVFVALQRPAHGIVGRSSKARFSR